MSKLFSDLVYALRQMRKAPGFTLVAVITLALGIGANAAIFTLIHAILLRPLPVKDPGALYRLGAHEARCCFLGGLQNEWDNYSYSLYQEIKKQTPDFEELAAFQAGSQNASVRRSGDTSPARPMHTEYVSGNYFSLFGLRPAVGRLLSPSDDQAGSTPAAVMSHRAWQNYYASDPSIVGSGVAINGFQFTVVGIAPAEFFGDRLTDTPPDFWLPLAMEPAVRGKASILARANLHWLYVMGRLKPGIQPAMVQSKVTLELQQWLNSQEGSSTVGDNDRSKIARQETLMVPAGGGVALLARNTAKGLATVDRYFGSGFTYRLCQYRQLATGAGRRSEDANVSSFGARSRSLPLDPAIADGERCIGDLRSRSGTGRGLSRYA